MKIHGRELTITNDRCGIYYDHILIMDKYKKLNEYTDWDYWVKRISVNPNFCPAVFHERIRCSNQDCNNCWKSKS